MARAARTYIPFLLALAEIVLVTACTGISGKSPSNSQQQQQASKPTVQISASPMQVQSGQAATLSWSATDATSVSIGGIGTVKAADSLPVSPKATTTYTITATNSTGGASASVTVIVSSPSGNPEAPTVSITATPNPIDAGGTTTLSWTSSNATTVAIDNGIGEVQPTGTRPGVTLN